jgi:signal transduction histidine kinase
LKLNLYSIVIFIIGLFATYIVTKNFQQIALNEQKQEVTSQSQSISYTLHHQITLRAKQLSITAQRFKSIEMINQNWRQDSASLISLFPELNNISIYLLAPQPALTIDNKSQSYFVSDTALLQQAKHLFPLKKQLQYANKTDIFQSKHKILKNNHVVTYQLAPIFINEKLIGYLQSTLNITQLLDQQVSVFQIKNPFSISENGRTIYTVLPENVLIHGVKQQSTISILGHDWELMIWPSHEHFFYQYAAAIGLILSILFAQLFYLVRVNKAMQYKLLVQKSNLVTINKDFKASKSKLIQSNKLASLGEIATGIAHEINQPLQVICIHADMCQESLLKQDYRLVDKSFRSILSQVERIEKIVKQVGSFGRDSELDNYNKEIPANIFENVINIVINQYNQEDVELRQVLPASLPSILCNKTQIEQVLVNLLINAKDAVEECDNKVVFIKAHDKQGKLYIEISDSGTGIEPSKLDDIFTPFYTTKALGRGTGLGLSISYSIIHQHKGEFQVSSEIGKGSTFTVILPLN